MTRRKKPWDGKLTHNMKSALKLLCLQDQLHFEATYIGRPTKQRLAKHGLATYIPYVCGSGEERWDGPMAITRAGELALADAEIMSRRVKAK